MHLIRRLGRRVGPNNTASIRDDEDPIIDDHRTVHISRQYAVDVIKRMFCSVLGVRLGFVLHVGWFRRIVKPREMGWPPP